MLIRLLAAAAILLPMTVAAEPPTPATILISGNGEARTPPDMATVGFTLRGEGATSDEAVARLRDSAKAVNTGIAQLLGSDHTGHSSQFAVAAVRSRECDANNYNQTRLSTGACAVLGYVATLPATVDTGRIKDAGTLAGLLSRLGALDVAVQRFWLRDEGAARRAATAAALANAQDQAERIAAAGHRRLGALIRVQDSDYSEVAFDVGQPPAQMLPPPPPPPPPIRVDLAPDPIRTTARLMVAYAIAE